jgi:photosystem II stability/assembly factor-like uncharacterized protein
MRKTRLALISLLTTQLLVAACSSSKAPGKWTPLSASANANVMSVNFVSEEAGWLNCWRAIYQQAPQANSNGNRSAKPKKPDEQTLAVGAPNDGYVVLQTTDGGQTWFEIPDLIQNKIRMVWFVDPQQGWAITTDRSIVRTTDGGQTWALQRQGRKVQATDTRYPKGTVEVPEQVENIRFADNQHGWAWGGGRKQEVERDGAKVLASHYPGVFLVTLDGGQQWSEVTYPFDREVEKVFFLNFRYGWANTADGGFYNTTDGGLRWTKIETKLPQLILSSIFFIDENNGWIADGDGRIAKTTDSGRTWRKLYEIKDEFKMRAVFFTDRNRGWAVGDNGVILYTTDGEATWLIADRTVPTKLTEVAFEGNTGWAVGPDGTVVRYENR